MPLSVFRKRYEPYIRLYKAFVHDIFSWFFQRQFKVSSTLGSLLHLPFYLSIPQTEHSFPYLLSELFDFIEENAQS